MGGNYMLIISKFLIYILERLRRYSYVVCTYLHLMKLSMYGLPDARANSTNTCFVQAETLLLLAEQNKLRWLLHSDKMNQME